MYSRAVSFAALAFFSALSLTDRLAGAAPDAGQILRDQPQAPDSSLRLPSAPRKAPSSSTVQTGGVTVSVREFRFTGHEGLVTAEALQAEVSSSIGRALSLGELQEVAGQVTALLRDKGFLLARAYLPRQDVSSGVVEIAIVQARVDGAVGVRKAAGSRLSQAHVQAVADAAIPPDQALREQGLERALLIINDLPGVLGRVLLEQGTAPGTTRVSLDISEQPLVGGSLWADDFGSRYTGSLRGNGLLSLNDLSGRGDQLTFLLSGSEDMLQGRASYSSPLGAKGLKGNLSSSLLDYSIGKEFAALDMKGSAFTLNGWLTYPLVLRRDRGVTLSLGYEFKALRDKMLGADTKDRRLHSGSLGLNGFSRDRLAGGGYTAWSVAGTFGTLDVSRLVTDELSDRFGPDAAGGFTRFNLSLSRQQQLPMNFSFAAAYFGQLSLGNLNSSEKLSLGGPYGVRAYPVGEASGDEGHQFNFELRRDLALAQPGTLQAIAFLDTGFIRLNKKRWAGDVNTATGKNSYQISGAGLGINYSWSNRLTLRLSQAWQLGSNEGRSLQGNNADGRASSSCLWATGQYRF